MNSESQENAQEFGRWADREDKWLVEVLRGEDPHDVDTAMQVLHDRHHSRLVAFVQKTLPTDRVDDVIQEIWASFYEQARVTAVKNVRAYLFGIATKVRANAVEKLSREREIERDIPPTDDGRSETWATGKSVEDILVEDEARAIEDHQLELLRYLPMIDFVLSDCQRVFWLLREIYHLPAKVAARLTGRKADNINAQTSKARKKVRAYFESDEFEIALINEELPRVWEPRPRREGAVVVERFAESFAPQFTQDELGPLGLSLEELQTQYVASLMLPRWHVGPKLEIGGLSMLLTRRVDWARWQELCARLERGEADMNGLIPEECLLNVDVDHGYINLSIQPIVELVPEDPKQTVSSDNTYLSVHSSGKVFPVVLGFFDQSLYTPELLERWPFVTPDMGL